MYGTLFWVIFDLMKKARNIKDRSEQLRIGNIHSLNYDLRVPLYNSLVSDSLLLG